MADKPVENLIYDFLEENFSAFLAEDETAETADFEINPSAYDKRLKDSGIFIGDPDTSMLPNGIENEVTEFNGLLTIEIYSRVSGYDKTARMPARQRVFEIKKKLVQLLEEYPTLNGRCCDLEILRQKRFFEDTNTEKWAIELVPIVVNPRNFN